MLYREPMPDGRTNVIFTLPSDDPPGEVSVVGSFNNWMPGAHPLNEQGGIRSATLSLEPGEHHFRYLASDGLWTDDQDADLVTEFGSVLHCTAVSMDEPLPIPDQASSPETRSGKARQKRRATRSS